jgi:hypothetical protein
MPPTSCRLCTPDAYKGDNPDVAAARLAAHQWGVLSLCELLRCGFSRNAVAVRVRNGRLHRLHRGVYAVGHANPPLEGRFLAAVKACGPTAVLSHYAAAAHWGIVTWDGRYPEVTVTGAARTHRGVRVHRSRTLQPQDVTRKQNVPITTPARTLHDLSSVLPFKAHRRATRQAHVLGLVNTNATTPPTRSELEDAVLDLILQGGLAPPDVNKPLRLNGRTVIPDFRWPAQRLVVEADGAAWHDNPIAREDDAERQALLEAHGERVVRVTWDQAIRHPHQTFARLAQAGVPKLASP